jgi:hypothetical protein
VRGIGRSEISRPILPPPFEQQVRIDAVLEREFRHRNTRRARRGGEAAFEFDRTIRTALAR